MRIIRTMRRQVAIWWKRQAIPDRFGKFSFDTPEAISCRWEDRAEEFRNMSGQLTVSRSVVYVDRAMDVGDKLMLGVLESDTPETPPEGAFEIQRFDALPDLKARDVLYTAYL